MGTNFPWEYDILLFLMAFSFIANITRAQQVNVEINGAEISKIYIYSIEGKKFILKDSLLNINKGKFHFSIPNNYNHGVYRLNFDVSKWINFINDGNNVSIQTNSSNILDSLHIIDSESNKLYYWFLKLNKAYKTKSELLQTILVQYPKDDDFYKTTQEKLAHLQMEYIQFVDSISQKNPDSFIARYIKSSQLPVIDFSLSPENQLIYLKAHSLDNVDFNDKSLLYSDLFTNKTIEYLTYYRNSQVPKGILEREFTFAIDSLLNKAKVNYQIYKQIVEYLIDGFKEFGFENDLEYIVNNYIIKDDICLDKESEISIQAMINQMKNLHINAIVPNVAMKDTSGREIDLDGINSNTTLILFYASWCPHCKYLIPKLVEYLTNRKGNNLKVFAISLDNSRTDWINFIKTNNMNWINVRSDKGWDCQAAKDYYIYATPTMFIVNRQLKIISKPMSIDEIKSINN